MSLDYQSILAQITGGNTQNQQSQNDGSDKDVSNVLDSIVNGAAGGLVTGILSQIGSLFGSSYWQQRYDKMNTSFSNADEICKAYIINISNGTFNNNDFNQFQEMFGYKAPAQGHGWDDRTKEVKYSTMCAFNLLGNQKGVPKDNLFSEALLAALAQTVKSPLVDDFNTKPNQVSFQDNAVDSQLFTAKKTFWDNFSFKQTSATPYLFWGGSIALLSGFAYLIKKAFFNKNNKTR